MSAKSLSSDHSISAVAALRAQIKEARAEIAAVKQAAKDALSQLMVSQQAQVANARHDGYVGGVADAKALFEKNCDAVKKETVSAEQKITKEFLGKFSSTKKNSSQKPASRIAAKKSKGKNSKKELVKIAHANHSAPPVQEEMLADF